MHDLKNLSLADGVYAISINGKIEVRGANHFAFDGDCSVVVYQDASPVAAPLETTALPNPPEPEPVPAPAPAPDPEPEPGLTAGNLEKYRGFTLKVPRTVARGRVVDAVLLIKHGLSGAWAVHRRATLSRDATEIVFRDLVIDKNAPDGVYAATVKIEGKEIYRKKIIVKPAAETQERFTHSRVSAFNPRQPETYLETLEFWDFGKHGNVQSREHLKAGFIHGPQWGEVINPKFNPQEWQNFKPFDTDNYVLADDHLKIIAKTAGAPRKDSITSGALRSKAAFLPDDSGALWMGIRCKLPAGKGLWPAWWLYPAPGQPRKKAELDMFEVVNTATETRQPGWQPLLWHSNAHINNAPPHQQKAAIHYQPEPLSDDYHTWIAVWSTEKVWLYFDGELRRVMQYPVGDDANGWGTAKKAQMLVNLAVGGGWPGPADDPQAFPAEMQVDWMGFWRLKMDAGL